MGCWSQEAGTRASGSAIGRDTWLFDKTSYVLGSPETQTKIRFSAYPPQKGLIICHTRVFSATLAYGITTVSTVSSWTTKDNSDKAQGPLTVKIALLMLRMLDFLLSTELLKLFILQRLVLDHPALLAASLWRVILDVRLLSAGSCPT